MDSARALTPQGDIPETRATIRQDLTEVVTDLWKYRELLFTLAKRDITVRYKQAVMGFAWALLMPMLLVSAGLIIRMAIASVSGRTLNPGMAGVLAVKGLCWSFFVGTIGFSSASLTGASALVSKVYFPREVLPLSALIAQCFDTSIAALAVSIALPFLGLQVTPALVWVPLLLLLLLAFAVATALFLSCANLFFRDVKYLTQILVTFGVFFTPVLYEATLLGPKFARLIMLNPIAPILEGMRLTMFQGHSLLEPLMVLSAKGIPVVAWQPWYLGYSAAWAVGGLVTSALIFHRAEFLFAEYL